MKRFKKLLPQRTLIGGIIGGNTIVAALLKEPIPPGCLRYKNDRASLTDVCSDNRGVAGNIEQVKVRKVPAVRGNSGVVAKQSSRVRRSNQIKSNPIQSSQSYLFPHSSDDRQTKSRQTTTWRGLAPFACTDDHYYTAINSTAIDIIVLQEH